MTTTKTTCDACEKDLSDAGPMPSYRLSLTAERIPNSGDIMYSVCVHPPLKHPHNFCGLNCLMEWIERKNRI